MALFISRKYSDLCDFSALQNALSDWVSSITGEPEKSKHIKCKDKESISVFGGDMMPGRFSFNLIEGTDRTQLRSREERVGELLSPGAYSIWCTIM